MRRDLSDAFLRALKPPETGRLEIWDRRVSGLVFRITPSGAASWCIRARTPDGKAVRPKLGAWPALGIAAARKAALDTLAAVHRGADPAREKKAKREARKRTAAEATVAERLAQWRAVKAPDWSDAYSAEVARLAERDVIPRLGKHRLRETTRGEWTALVEAKRKAAPPPRRISTASCRAS
jgi:hypothetical protein